MSDTLYSKKSVIWREGAMRDGSRDLAEEVAVALVYDGSTEAVMMATPADLEDFALGFSLSEGIVTHPDDIVRMEIVHGEIGIEARLWLTPERGAALGGRRRHRTGPVGCGLCGVDSLEAALRPVPQITSDLHLSGREIVDAIGSLTDHQPLGARTRAVHAAGLWCPGQGYAAVREDVGRHNALDKLAGAARRMGLDTTAGAVVLTSRVSVDLVQKVGAMGAPVLIAISAPTAHAVRLAEGAGLTLVAVARGDGFEVYAHGHRISAG